MMEEIKRYLEGKKRIDDIFTSTPAVKDAGVFV
jgi:hypothetical protein